MMFTTNDFDPSLLPFSPESRRWISIDQHNRLFRLLPAHILAHAVEQPPSLKAKVLPSKKTGDDSEQGLMFGRIALELCNGICKFKSFDGDVFEALAVNIGKPVGGGCGVEQMKSIIVFTEGPIDKLANFLSQLIEMSEKSEEGRFTCYTWHIEHSYWREETKIKSRPLQSVVLPKALKSRLVADLDKFLSARTKDFYNRNGIPYRRSYLFYGVPGTGKTSLVQALAGHFQRSISFLLPTHPKMTDDSLREAINQIPDDTIVVFEDIDALFTSDRSNRVHGSNLTFSGLLNALDGISNPNGQIFILTTNLRDNLDDALIRNGRVDMHVEFGYAVAEQMEQMWCNFYPEAAHLASEFADGVRQRLKEKHLQLTTSALQHFFVMQMDSTPEEALQQLDKIVEEIIQNSSKSMLEAATVLKPRSKNGKARPKNRTARANKEAKSGEMGTTTVESTVETADSAMSGEEGAKSDEKQNRPLSKNKEKRAAYWQKRKERRAALFAGKQQVVDGEDEGAEKVVIATESG